MSVRWLLLVMFWAVPAWLAPAGAQQNVRVPVEQGGRTVQLAAQLFKPATTTGSVPAVAIFHGCGGPGQNTARMAGLLASWGYAALVVDSFSARGLKDVCGRNWPTQADAEARAHDIDAALAWLGAKSFVDPKRLAVMGYSYGGGVAMLRALSGKPDDGCRLAGTCAPCLVYPDCALADALGPKLTVRQPTLFAMGALDDWTPVSQCSAVIDRVDAGPRSRRDAHLRRRTPQLRCAGPAGALSRRRRQPQQARRLLRCALRRQRDGMEGLRRRRAGVPGEEPRALVQARMPAGQAVEAIFLGMYS